VEKVKAYLVKGWMSKQSLAFFWVLYYVGVKKSEAYERTVQDCQLTESVFIIDFHKRKKGGAKVPPIELPLWFPGVDLIAEQWQRAKKKRPSRKLIERTTSGERKSWHETKQWLFPRVQKQWALEIVKKLLGKAYYPHFLRLNRITEICSNPEANIEMIKSWTGIKSIRVIEKYMGVSKKQQNKAVNWMGKQINPETQRESQVN
jgi:hypothetical protein